MLARCQALAHKAGTPQSMRDVSISLSNVAVIHQARGQLDNALPLLHACVTGFEAVAAVLKTPSAEQDLAEVRKLLADVERVLARRRTSGSQDA